MKTQVKSEQGQAIVMIAFAIMGMLALTALAMDGGHAFSDRRQAQNAADAAALAAALAYQEKDTSTEIEAKVMASALANGYPQNTARSTVTFDPNGVVITGVCPSGEVGREYVVTIDSYLETWFAQIVGITQIHNSVSATARGCDYYYAPFYDGNAIVALAPGTDVSFNASGNADWEIACDPPEVSGGIFSNGAANRSGSAVVTAPSLTVVGTGSAEFLTDDEDIPADEIQGPMPEAAYAYPGDILEKMPRQPACNGTAYIGAGGKYYPETGKDGSVIPVNWDGGQTYAPGLFCVSSIGPNWHGTLSAKEGTTFYITDPNFDLKLAGSGDGMSITAPTSGEYLGYAIILPLTCGGIICDLDALTADPPTQTVDPCTGPSDKPRMDLRGNGVDGISGSIVAPSACITMYGNAASTNHSQIIAYMVDGGGTANINVCFLEPENPQEYHAPVVELVK